MVGGGSITGGGNGITGGSGLESHETCPPLRNPVYVSNLFDVIINERLREKKNFFQKLYDVIY